MRIKSQEAAEKLDMPVQLFRHMVYSGKFSEFAVGTPPSKGHRGIVYVNKERLEAYVAAQDLRSTAE